MSNSQPLLSVAMIVKNEEENLPECLEQIKSFADEICIVDTGSTDNTVEIAKSAGAKIGTIKWNDDFAYARNKSLKLCTGKWIFIIDADERISEDDRKKLRQIVENDNLCAYRLWTRNYTNRVDRADFLLAKEDDEWNQEFLGWFPSAKVRLFPNRPEIKFEGHVHETVLFSLQQLNIPVIDNEEILIHHYGERGSEEKLKQKQEMYITLGKKKIQQYPTNPFFYAELASQYAEMGHFPEALEYYRKALEIEPSHADWWCEIGSILFIVNHKKEAEQSFRIAVKMNPDYFPAWRNLSLLYIEAKQWSEALSTLQEALRLHPDDREIIFAIGSILLELGETEKAKDYLSHFILPDKEL